MNLAILTVSAGLVASADRRSSVNVRLLGVGVGVLDANERRGTRGDAAFVLGTRRGEKPSHFNFTSPQPLICVCLKLDKICSHSLANEFPQ